MKSLLKQLVVMVLGWQVRRLRRHHDIHVIGVVGSIGKTSTKTAIAQLLGAKLRVRYQTGNYNDIVSVPLVFFGNTLPSLFNPLAWTRLFIDHERQIRGNYPFDVVILELGTDGPGQIKQFKNYLDLDLAFVTAITSEHMEFFGTLERVASEELSVTEFSKRTMLNADLIPPNILTQLDYETYSIDQPSDYKLRLIEHVSNTFTLEVQLPQHVLSHHFEGVSKVQLYSLLAAVIAGVSLDLSDDDIKQGINNIRPVAGRMQLLQGKSGTTIIDDTYNASPEAVRAALEAVYGFPAQKRIALLGNMNELGELSATAHKEIGEYCDPQKLDLVVTLGPDANNFLAPAAEARGCRVVKVRTPYEAAEVIEPELTPDAVLLAKGSQNGVYAEEAVKLLLEQPSDDTKLVRQSSHWLKRKAASFKNS